MIFIVAAVVVSIIVFLMYRSITAGDHNKKSRDDSSSTVNGYQPAHHNLPNEPSLTDTRPAEERQSFATAPANAEGDSAAAAKKFAVAWIRKDLKTDEWRSNVKQYCGGDLASRIDYLEPVQIPGKEVTGDPQSNGNAPDILMTYSVPTDKGTLIVTEGYAGRTWSATDVDWQVGVGNNG